MLKFINHLFLPQSSNNYRPKLLHPKILIVFILFFFSAGIVASFVRNNYPSVLGISSNISVDQLLAITNQDRQQNGLPPLSLNDQLDKAALDKGNDMFSQNYWAHISPTGTPPWYFIKNSGYNYIYAGENLARGYTSAQDVVNAWMASPEHRANMLSNKYNNVGFAVLTGNLTGEDTVLVVEMFGSTSLAGNQNVASAPTEQVETPSQPVTTVTPVPTATLTPIQKPTKEIATKKLSSNISSPSASIVDAATFSSNIAKAAVLIFMFVLILDMIIIERRKILRFVGHNFDHILFFGLVFALILVILRGHIL